MSDIYQQSLEMHSENKGKLATHSKVPMETATDLARAYSPGVAEPCRAIAADPEAMYEVTGKGNSVAIISDGSAVLGLGNIGPAASYPVMEGKALLLKHFADIDAYPIVLDTQDADEIVRTVELISLGFGGINLEDISAPRCFEIEERLQNLGIPVFHDDQHGTAIVVYAGLINALKVANKKLSDTKIVVNGVGAAGVAITKALLQWDTENTPKELLLCDSKGIIYEGRDNLNPVKEQLAQITNKDAQRGSLTDALAHADIFIGVSKGNLLTVEMIDTMNDDPIVFALANPDPELDPKVLDQTKTAIFATGRSDLPNQVNNVLAFPGIFKAALQYRYPIITEEMKKKTAHAIASLVMESELNATYILPKPFDDRVVPAIVESLNNL